MDTMTSTAGVETHRSRAIGSPWRMLMDACKRHVVAIVLSISLGAVFGCVKATYWPVWEARAFVNMPEASACGFPQRHLASRDPALIAAYFKANDHTEPFAKPFLHGTLTRNQLAAIVTQTTGVVCSNGPLETVVRWRDTTPELARSHVTGLINYLRDVQSHPKVMAFLDARARNIADERDRVAVMLESQRELRVKSPSADAQRDIAQLEVLLRKIDADANVVRETMAAALEPGVLGRRLVDRMSRSADRTGTAAAFDPQIARQFRMEWQAEARQVEKLTFSVVTAERVTNVSPPLLWAFIGAGLAALLAATALFATVAWSYNWSVDNVAA